MWGRLFLSAVVVVLIIVWLVAIYLMIVDPRTVLQKWQRGLWSTAHTIRLSRRRSPLLG
jgi:succinate dehydrogenase hydrophobic anchor subunit